MSLTSVHEWHKRFRERCKSLNEDFLSNFKNVKKQRENSIKATTLYACPGQADPVITPYEIVQSDSCIMEDIRVIFIFLTPLKKDILRRGFHLNEEVHKWVKLSISQQPNFFPTLINFFVHIRHLID